MKKISKYILTLLLALPIMVMPINVYAKNVDEITAPSAVLMDEQTGKVLFEKNPHEIRPCASITKIMTLILIFESIDRGELSFKQEITASSHAASMGGSDIFLEPGEIMTADDMIKSIVVASANDAAVAMAEHISGSEEAFVDNMNKKANELHMYDTTFKNCNGLDEDGHLTSAYDVAIMSRELMKHDKIFDYTSIWIEYLRGGKTQLVNTNKLLKSYEGITGLKTGTTSKAGSCISATAKRNNLSLISVVLGSSSGKDRFSDAAALLDYGFSNFTTYTPTINLKDLNPISVVNGMESTIQPQVNISGSFLIPKGSEKSISSNIQLISEIQAPVEKGQNVGNISYCINGEVIAEYNIVSSNSVPSMSISSVFNLLLNNLVKM